MSADSSHALPSGAWSLILDELNLPVVGGTLVVVGVVVGATEVGAEPPEPTDIYLNVSI